MKRIAALFFEANMLKGLTRSGYSFFGSGKESVAEHCFMTAFICFILAKIEPDVNGEKIISMALVHDLPESRTGDFNYVQKKYSQINEDKAVSDLIKDLSFGKDIKELIDEFNEGKTLEAKLTNDADQLSFIIELKKLKDTGAKSSDKWLAVIVKRLKTDAAKKLAKSILSTNWDDWWLNGYSE